ncbi:membrane protein insertase YidC [Metabacillus sp. RGM 3146]|uniref:membrane protein insertase YidC n=1 Tax=Metabacillus sp. RGM 3146 TaxID=3401092 RepID=UPI003B9B09A0
MGKKLSAFIPVRILALFSIILLAGLVLGGCQSASGQSHSITSQTPGFFNHYFVYTFSVIIKTFASWFGGSYGMAIILTTLLIRLVLMPFMLKQTKNQMVMKAKMAKVQPELKEIQEKMKNTKDPEAKTKLQQETMKLYQKHGVNPLASLAGCLPLLLQLPILMGFYYAIRQTPEIASHTFLWFNLGHTDMILPILAAAIYLVQFRVSLKGMDEAQQKQMAAFGYLSPIMMGIFSFSAAAALPLYWTVGGIFVIFQTMLSQRLYGHKIETHEISVQK